MDDEQTYPNLKQQIDVLLPCLDRALVDTDQISGLRALATRLTPIPQGGFECWLGPDKPQTDLHQCLYPTDDELVLLRKSIAVIASSPDTGRVQSVWAHLYDFLTEWSDPSSPLHGCASQVWLEYDNERSCLLPLPSIFVNLLQKVPLPTETYNRHAVLFLDRLLGSHWRPYKDKLYACFAHCPEGAFVAHIGVMLSRDSRNLRLNIKRLQPGSLIPYLQRLGWPGNAEELKAVMTELSAFFEDITVCLDIGRNIHPQIGFECVALKSFPKVGHWDVFLDYLVEKGLCESGKRAAILNWPGQTTPMNAKAPWPDHLIAASLLKPRDRFTVFNRRLTHIKIVWRPQHRLGAKAYLWYRHKWLSKK